MDPIVRPARREDKRAIASFTKDTFDWGDYVAERWDDWLDADRSLMVVATDGDDVAIAMARAQLLSDRELWLQAARVHPDHRGEGIGGRMNAQLIVWGRAAGARIARLLIEDWNAAAQRQVAKSGYRRVASWVYAERDILLHDPAPTGNGGKRVPGEERLKPAPSAESGPAFMAWSTSELARAGRGLTANAWQWRTLVVEDLVEAARSRELYESPSGWAIIAHQGDHMQVPWFMGTPDDTARLVRAILDRAIETNAEHLAIWAPVTDEVTYALERIGCRMHPSAVWERLI